MTVTNGISDNLTMPELRSDNKGRHLPNGFDRIRDLLAGLLEANRSFQHISRGWGENGRDGFPSGSSSLFSTLHSCFSDFIPMKLTLKLLKED